MAKEPAWKAHLGEGLAIWMPGWTRTAINDLLAVIEPHIKAAEQRGYSAGVSKNGATVRELRQQLAKED